MDILSLYDYLILPFYIIGIYILAYQYRNRHYPPGHPWRRYFMPGLFLKIGGALFIALIYVYYYGYGDSLSFFRSGQVKNSALAESPLKWINLILEIPKHYDSEYVMYTSQIRLYQTGGNSVIISLGAVISLLGLNSYLAASVLFAVFSFTGIWALFRTFATLYPESIKYMAYAIIYFPSVIVWGSGLFKDTVCLFALGWIIHLSFEVVVNKKRSTKYLLPLFICIISIAVIKIYIIIALLPAVLFWVLNNVASRSNSFYYRIFLKSVAPAIVLLLSIGAANYFSDYLGVYSLDNVIESSETLRNNILVDSGEEGSGYELGEIESTPLGLLMAFPKAVNVTLFRPYLWEARKVIILFSALEAFALLLLTLYVIFKTGFFRAVAIIRTDSNVQFCLIFTLIFAFAVGISTYNFGTLSRYKIPCLPFYGIALSIIYYQGNRKKQLFKQLYE